jgi:hypothetical protein
MKRLSVLLLMFLLVPFVRGQSVTVEEAFMAVAEAEKAGGEIEDLVADLNQAIELLEEGETEEATLLLESVMVRAETARVQGTRERFTGGAVAVFVALVFVGLAVVVWLRGDEWFWRLWRYTKRGFVVAEP